MLLSLCSFNTNANLAQDEGEKRMGIKMAR